MGAFRDVYAQPAEMVNWRALIVNARPAIGNTSGVVLFLMLSLLTLAVLAWVARGSWSPGSRTLDLQLVAVIVATFLVSYHSHVHGLALLAVPLAGLWRASAADSGVRLTILAFVFLPTLALFWSIGALRGFTINYDEPLWIVWPVLNVTLLVALLLVALFEAWCARWPAHMKKT
jgi:hypothetical protein